MDGYVHDGKCKRNQKKIGFGIHTKRKENLKKKKTMTSLPYYLAKTY